MPDYFTSEHVTTYGTQTETIFVDSVPRYVGYLVIANDLRVAITRKPSRFHLVMMRLVFGWTWDAAPTGEAAGNVEGATR